jgi:hypothetical protein
MKKHALLSASGASRWLNCTPSAVLESKIKSTVSQYADEGTVAHALAELELKKYFALISNLEYNKELKDIEETEYYDDAMAEYISDYVVFVVEQYNGYDSPAIFLEQHLDMQDYVPDGFGTSDVNIVSDSTLEIIDLKYGKGVAVSAEENKQMMLYSLGAYNEFSYMGNILFIKMTIYQPRIDNYSSWLISVKDLLAWAESELKPKAKLAYKGEGDFVAGDWCRFCKVKGTCRAFTNAQLEVAKLDFSDLKNIKKMPADKSLLTDKEIALILQRTQQFKQWINAIEEHALDQAVNHNKTWPDMKLVEGRSIRKYLDPIKVKQALIKKKYTETDITESKILSITKMEKFLGPSVFVKILGKLIIKPSGSLTLVHKSDKRPEYNSLESAKKDFNGK